MTEETVYDYGDDGVAPTGNVKERIKGLVDEYAAAAKDIADAEALLEKANTRFKTVSEKTIPEFMDEVGLPSFTTDDGLEIEVGETIQPSIKEENRPAAHKWLRDNQAGSLIKVQVVAAFTPGETEKADKVRGILEKEGVEFEDKSSVHPSTLKSFVTERVQKGLPLPDSIGVFRRRIATIKNKRKKGKSYA